jgi:hypothetical protein
MKNLNLRIVLLLSFASGIGCGQTTQPTIQQKSEKSTCANIVALAGNVDLNCSSLTPAQSKAISNIPAILKMTLENQNYLDAIMKQLQEMSKTQPGQITVNGNVSQGGNGDCQANAIGGSATVESCGASEAVTGVYSYKLNGNLVITEGARQTWKDGEVDSYRAIVEASNSKDWARLNEITEKEISRAPRWLTPYLFSGVANLQLCNKEIALKRLNYFIERATSDPSYSDPTKGDFLGQAKSIKSRLENGPPEQCTKSSP